MLLSKGNQTRNTKLRNPQKNFLYLNTDMQSPQEKYLKPESNRKYRLLSNQKISEESYLFQQVCFVNMKL